MLFAKVSELKQHITIVAFFKAVKAGVGISIRSYREIPFSAAARARIHLSVQSPMLRLARARRCRQLLPRGRQKPDQSSTDRFGPGHPETG